ncbi:protein abnormal spindle-like isoform X1 [Aphis craccivora]|uniref:Protein abnormal spindle-like isoform X1 n=1 Tax=Aphis craccivora TaxID=307492 RepID=A0A6G0Z295_APHCR|nr:protein abnormal spindle-like isoform X1 [Aphis craccivora]
MLLYIFTEFSPPVKFKSKHEDEENTVLDYYMVLAPFQKQTQVEFSNIRIKETAMRFLTVTNLFDKPRQFILPHSNDGIYFDVYEFTLQPNSQRKLSITWQPSVYGNMRKLIRIEQVDNNRKYDFVIFGNCIDPLHKKLKGTSVTLAKSKNTDLTKNRFNSGQNKITLNKTRFVRCASERVLLVDNATKISAPIRADALESPMRRQTYLVGEKENIPNLENNMVNQDTIFISSDYGLKHADKNHQSTTINNLFNTQSANCDIMTDDSLDESLNKLISTNSPFNDFFLTPLKSTENLLSPFSTTKKCINFDIADENTAFTSFNTSPFKPIDASTGAKTYTPDNRKPTRISVNLCEKFKEIPKDNSNIDSTTFIKNISPNQFALPLKVEQSFNISQNQERTTTQTPMHHTKIISSSTKPKRPSFVLKNSPYYKCSPKSSMISKNRLKQYSILSPRTAKKHLRTPKLDKCDQYLKCLANPELVYHNNAEDPFLKMSQYYESEWLDRQESDMIRWLNALLMPTDKLADEEQINDLEQAAVAWEEASKTSHRNKPMQFATQKDLFVSQIYKQSPQQWSALRKATSNLITSTNVATVLSKLTISIEKDFITVRDDRQIHLDLNLKKKITDLLKCYNPLWLRIGLEAVYGQIIHINAGSHDLDGLGWFIRKNLFNNDFIKQKFTKATVLQVNLPTYNIAMKKFILRKIFMLVYFLDRAKEQQLIRHNPCLFKIDSPYKSSYDFLMGFCADMVTANGDINRRLRSIGYNLTHKQTHLDEVDYAVKSLNDLRDGTRITRVVEILFKGEPLSQKLRLPAISKLQKIHNVNLALTRISEHINIEGNISTRDIVNGHREKMLSLFWQLIYKYLTPRYNKAAVTIQHWWRNNNLKLVIIKRIRAKQTFKRHLAAARIQAYVRGYLTRKHWPHTQAKLIENREKLHLASTKIKQYLQDKLKLLTEDRKQYIILRRTTVFVQRKIRSKIAMKRDRQQFIKIKQSALLIQKVYRGFMIRKNWSQIKNSLIIEKINRINAINIIKRSLRKNLPPTEDEIYYKKIMHTTLTVQRRFRANKLMKVQMEAFIKLKKNTIVIQQKFRAKQAMIKQKEHYLKLKMCALKLQAVTRGYIVRKKWSVLHAELQANRMRLTVCSNIIKRTLRSNLPLTDDRIKFLDLKRSAIIIQNRFRALKEMKLQRQKYLKLKTVTLTLQSVARGYIVRKQWPSLRNKLIVKRQYLINCSNIIKRVLRKNLPLTEDRIKFLDLKRSAIIVQNHFRALKEMKLQRQKYLKLKTVTLKLQKMKLQRQKYLKLKTVTLKLQSVARGYIVRRQWPSLRNELIVKRQYLINCSNIIKRALRKNLPVNNDRLRFLELRRATTVIQSRFKAKRQLKKYQTLRNNVIIVQRRFKANVAMRQQQLIYENIRARIIRLQAFFRGYLVLKKWPETKCKLEANKKQLISASNTIKKFLRLCLSPTPDRLRYIKLRQSVMNLQARYRATVAMKSAEREYLLLKCCTITLQRRYRAHKAMLMQKQRYELLKKSTIILQTHIRGYLARRRWLQLKDNMEVKRRLALEILELHGSSHNTSSTKQLGITFSSACYAYLILSIEKKITLFFPNFVSCKRLLAGHVFLFELKMKMRAAVQLQIWIRNVMLNRKHLQKENVAASKIQAIVRGFLVRKKLPKIKEELHIQKLVRAATLIQAIWRGYTVRKRYQCRRETIRFPKKGALTLGKRHNDVVDVLNKQKRNEYSYRELTTVFWNLGNTCTTLSKELCLKTSEGTIIDYMFHFLHYSNQSQPSLEAREPAIRVLTNLLKYHETSWHIWVRTVNADMVKDLIKMMKTCCGKVSSKKLYCSIATWLWIALQDPEKKIYIKKIPSAIVDLKFMMDTLKKRYSISKLDKKTMVLPSTRPTWSIGSKCQKCFDSDYFATIEICKLN